MQRFIEDPLSEELLLGRFQAGDQVIAELDQPGSDTVIFRRNNLDGGLPPEPELAVN